jgi:Domain of unknown function (DUF4326)
MSHVKSDRAVAGIGESVSFELEKLGQKYFVWSALYSVVLKEAMMMQLERAVRTEVETLAVKPHRIQLKRTKGWRMPPNTLKVDRSTKWGNPFKVEYKGMSPELAVQSFKNVLDEFEEYQISSRLKVTIDDIRRELRGKNLACWCKSSEVCHADVLLEIANG